MSDDLRDRIAAVIRREVPCHPPAADRIADAVMAVVSDEYVNSRGMFHEPDRCLGCEECADV